MPDIVIDTRPPVAFGLTWTDKGQKRTDAGHHRRLFEARSTVAFDNAWKGRDRQALRDMGYASQPGDGCWMAQFWARPTAEQEAAAAAAATASIKASRATDADVEIAAPPGLAYLPYQIAGIAYAMARNGTLIGDEMGLGKTIQAIGVANAMGAKRILIACPASLKLNWERELRTWLVEQLPIYVVRGGKAAWPNVGNGGVVIVNYDVMHAYASQIRKVSWDLLVCDEAHMLKSRNAKRTRAVFGGAEIEAKGKVKAAPAVRPIAANRRLLLTGTPAENRPAELYPLLSYLDESWGKWWDYAKLYCALHKDRRDRWDYSGISNAAELQDRLRATVMVRRLKQDVLKDLPPKVRQVIPLEADTEILRKMLRDEHAAHDAHERLKAAGGASVGAAFAELSRRRQEVGVAKVPFVVEHVLRDENPVVVFAHHLAVVAALGDALVKEGRTVVRVVGDMSTEDRQASVDSFQGGRADVIIGTFGAMGTGHTLVRSSHVVCAEIDWTPGKVSQAEDRCHRYSQRSSVHVDHLLYEGSLDSRMFEVMFAKKKNLFAALDKQAEDPPAIAPSIQDMTVELPGPGLDEAALREIEAAAEVAAAERAERKRQADAVEAARREAAASSDGEVRTKLRAALESASWALPADDLADAERLASWQEGQVWINGNRNSAMAYIERLHGYMDRAAERVAGAEVSDEDLARVADPEVRTIVLEGCRYLSGLDGDRAVEENGVGWSKTTSWTGHWLAGHESLEAREAAVGLGLLRIHRRQLAAEVQERLFGVAEAAPADTDLLKALRDALKHSRLSASNTAAASELIALDVLTPQQYGRASYFVARLSENAGMAAKRVRAKSEATPDDPALDFVVQDRVIDPSMAQVAEKVLQVEPEAQVVEDRKVVIVPREKSEKPENVAARARLVQVGEAMYGPRWMTDLARDLDVNDRTVRRWDSGATPIPAYLWDDIAGVARRRRDRLAEVIADLAP